MKYLNEIAWQPIRRIAAISAVLIVLTCWSAIWLIPLPERLDVDHSSTITYADGRPAHVSLASDDRWRIEARHDEVDPAYIEALIELEDRRFFDHFGVDPIAVVRAAGSNVASGRVVSGASTITMQVVRMAEPRPRTLRSKAVEAFRAVQLERHYTKEEILDLYLQLLPFGHNYEGLETAALVYFGHDASRLTPAQIATLLAVPQAPTTRTPSPENAEELGRARNEIAEYLLERGALPRGMRSERLSDEEAMAAIEATPPPSRFRRMPREIPHLAHRLRAKYPESKELRTTVDPSQQRLVEQMVQRHRRTVGQLGGDHLSVVVMDHQTGELKAAVGNFDYASEEPGQKMAGFDVPRSTGSLLKPFLLARGIDKGVASPSQRVVDAPVNFGGYRPQNYDGTYDGLVRLDSALERSLNIPFVNLLNQVGIDDFLMVLNRIGAPYPEGPPEDHGLSYAVGGIDATPKDVATMFSALARRGDAVSLQQLKADDEARAPTAMKGALSPEAVWMVREVMQRRDRPDFPGRAVLRSGVSPYAWKTGTSMGYRDAWTAGFGPRHVVVVWAGNLDYRPGRRLVGELAAAPLFFDIIEAIDPADSRVYGPPPEGLEPVEVCAFSGHLPTGACEETDEVHLRRKSVPTEPCPYHVHVDVDVDTGEAVTPACRGDRQVEERSFLQLPASVRRFYDISGQGDRAPPDYARECRVRSSGDGPRIDSPPDDTVVTLMSGVPTSAQKVPLEASVGGGGEVNWFVDGRFIGRVDDGRRLWWEPEPGEHEFVATDRHGQSARVVLEVE